MVQREARKGQEKGGKGDISEEVQEDDDELHAWCLLEESKSKQWQEVVNKNSKLKSKKVAHESQLSVENKSCASPRKVIEVKDSWVNIMATMDTGAVGHVMPAEMFLRVKLDRTTTTKKFLQVRARSAQMHKIQERERCEALDLNEEGRASWECRCAG